MDDLLYDEEVKGESLVSSQEGDQESMGDVEALLRREKSKMTSSQKRAMEESGKDYGDHLKEKKLEEEENEINYEEESFEEVKVSSPSLSQRVQSAKLGSSVRFAAVDENDSPRPKSSPAGRTRDAKHVDDKLPSTVHSPIGKAGPKRMFSPVGKEGSIEPTGSDALYTPPRSMSAPSTRALPYATPGYTGSPVKSAGRRRLEQVLGSIHAMKTKGRYTTGEMQTFKNALPTGQVTQHQRWTYKEDGVKVEATPPLSMQLQHHSVSDYRAFRPTSGNKRLMPAKQRDTSQFLLPGQKKKEELLFYDGKKLRHTMHDCMAKAMTRVEKCNNEWEEKVAKANFVQQGRLQKIHKAEMKELVAYFQGYKPSEFMSNLLDEDRCPRHVHGKHFTVTAEDKEYVNRQLAAQAQHNENRMHVLRTHLKNRHADELRAIKENTRAPLELLSRIRHTQEEVLEETAKKVLNKIVHAEKIIKTIDDSGDPTVLLRAQKAEEYCMTSARSGIKRMAVIADGIESVFEEALLDYIDGERALELVRGGGMDVNAAFSGTGKAKSDLIRPHSSSYTPQVFDRKINGYRYRSRSPPRGSPQKDIETKEWLSRPKPLSARKGKLQKSRHDVLINQARIPFSSKQYGKGREGRVQAEIPRLWTSTRFAREQEERRPNTAPAGAPDGGGLDDGTPRDPRNAGDTENRAKSGARGSPAGGGKRRPKTAGNMRTTNESVPVAEGKWDPSTGHLEGALAESFDNGPDDDASLGIMQDPGDDMSIADSIGEGDFMALSGEDLEKAKLDKRRNLATAHELAVMERKGRAKRQRDRQAKKLAPKQRLPDNPTDELCAECDKFFSGKSKCAYLVSHRHCSIAYASRMEYFVEIFRELTSFINTHYTSCVQLFYLNDSLYHSCNRHQPRLTREVPREANGGAQAALGEAGRVSQRGSPAAHARGTPESHEAIQYEPQQVSNEGLLLLEVRAREFQKDFAQIQAL